MYAAAKHGAGWFGGRKVAALAVLVAAGALTACSDDNGSGPDSVPEVVDLLVSGVRLDASTFASNGRFELGLVARDEDGDAILDTDLGVSARVTSVTAAAAADMTLGRPLFQGGGNLPTVTVVRKRTEAAGSKPIAAAIDIDDSGSMSSSDPNELRADAAELFWQAVLGQRSTNEVALFDFGAGSSHTFTDSRLLQGWTTDESLLAAQLSNIAAVGGTPLYESVLDVVAYIDSSRSATNFSRVILLLTDGQPGSTSDRQAAIDAANNADITIHTVGLGPASDLSSQRSESAVQAVRELAEQTGGVYASATDAAGLGAVFQTLAQVTSQGQLVTAFRINPVPASGTRVSGTVTVTGGGGSATANWSFVVP